MRASHQKRMSTAISFWIVGLIWAKCFGNNCFYRFPFRPCANNDVRGCVRHAVKIWIKGSAGVRYWIRSRLLLLFEEDFLLERTYKNKPKEKEEIRTATKAFWGNIMANPKHRHSKARRDKRRTHKKLIPPSFSICPQCHERMLPHRTCLSCGYYKKVAIIAVEEGWNLPSSTLIGSPRNIHENCDWCDGRGSWSCPRRWRCDPGA